MTTEKRNDEIDLIELFLKFYIFFKRNFWFLLISVFIGSGLGYSTKFFAKEYYESSMLIESYTLSNDIIIEFIDRLKENIAGQENDYLSSLTGLEVNELVQLKGIVVTAEEFLVKKNNTEIGYIKITVRSNQRVIFENLSISLQKYLSNKTYIKSEIDLFIKQNKTLISKIDNEISQFEETYKIPIAKSDINIYNEQKESELIKLLKLKLELEKELLFAKPFRIIEDFTYPQTIKKTATYTFIGGALFGFIVLLYLIIRKINKKIS